MEKKKIPRELTAAERREIRRLVTTLCASYDSEYGCLPLDCECYMLNKWWTGSLCTYFESSVLPANPILARALKGEPPVDTKPCAICGKRFPMAGRKAYCSDKCREQGQKLKDAQRAKKYRQNKGGTVTD
jgi:predicted nucleic acid-binding Zn ribbon protein